LNVIGSLWLGAYVSFIAAYPELDGPQFGGNPLGWQFIVLPGNLATTEYVPTMVGV
jgi:hypothetical protein